MERRLKQVYRLVFPHFIPNFWAVVPFLLAYFIFQQYGTWEVFKFTVSGLLVHWIVYSLLMCIFAYLPNRNWVSRLWIICLWLYLWLFLIIGLIDFGSNLFWHRPVSFRLAVVGYYEISKLPMRGFYNKYYILGILTLAMGLSLGIYWSYSTNIFTHLRRSTKTICHHAQVLGKQPFAWFGVIIIVSVVWMNINFFRAVIK